MGHMMEERWLEGAHDGRRMVRMGHMMEEGWLEWGT